MAGDPRRFDDLFQEFGPIAIRRFFGGEGIYCGEVMIGMVFDDTIYLTTDAETRKSFVAEKCKPFKFTKRSTGEVVSTHWYAVPERLYDGPDELAQWARVAFSVASNSETSRKKQAKRARAPAQKHSKRQA
jgi:DNA transformation protein